MDESLESIIDSLPPKPSRSKLEPYGEFIRELRRRGRSYQEITDILRDRCGVTAGVHTVYNFVRVRDKAEKGQHPRKHGGGRPAETATSVSTEIAQLQPRPQPSDDVWKNIEKLKQRQSAPPGGGKVFVYDDNEPLKLVRGIGKSSSREVKAKPE